MHKSSNSFKDLLSEWQDWDYAEFVLAVALGLLQDSSPETFLEHKGIHWSDNNTGELLARILKELSAAGILEHEEENQKFRWNPGYKTTA